MVSLFIEEENVKLYVPLALEGELQAVFHLRGQRKPLHCISQPETAEIHFHIL